MRGVQEAREYMRGYEKAMAQINVSVVAVVLLLDVYCLLPGTNVSLLAEEKPVDANGNEIKEQDDEAAQERAHSDHEVVEGDSRNPVDEVNAPVPRLEVDHDATAGREPASTA